MLVYVREPHAGEKSFTEVRQPRTYEERKKLAEATCDELHVETILVLDEMDDQVRAAYGDLPNCAYLIGKDGRVFYKQAWANASTLEPAIQALLKIGGKGDPQPSTIETSSGVNDARIGQTPSGRRLLRVPDIYPVLGVPVADHKKQEIAWLPSLEEAQSIAAKSGVPVFVEFYLPACSFCRAMGSESLIDPKVVELSRRMACVRLNVEEKDVSALFDQLGFAGTPSFVFYPAQGEGILLKQEGFLEASELLILMYTALEKTRE